jgi:hypothetical protein
MQVEKTETDQADRQEAHMSGNVARREVQTRATSPRALGTSHAKMHGEPRCRRKCDHGCIIMLHGFWPSPPESEWSGLTDCVLHDDGWLMAPDTQRQDQLAAGPEASNAYTCMAHNMSMVVQECVGEAW